MMNTNAAASELPPLKRVTVLTAIWLLPSLLLLSWPILKLPVIPYGLYLWVRNIAVIVLIMLVFVGITKAASYIGPAAKSPWYTSATLVSLVLFWSLFPPSWFFLEYFMFDTGYLALPDKVAKAMATSSDSAKVKAEFMALTATYADLSSKIWISVGAALATAIAVSRR